MSDKVTHASGAHSSYFSPFNFYMPFESVKLTAKRFKVGNHKYENDDTVYANMNWLKAVKSRDVEFFRNRAGHAMDHLIAEMHGQNDEEEGGNLGAIGWFLEIMAYVKKHDPHLYGAIQGKWNIGEVVTKKS